MLVNHQIIFLQLFEIFLPVMYAINNRIKSNEAIFSTFVSWGPLYTLFCPSFLSLSIFCYKQPRLLTSFSFTEQVQHLIKTLFPFCTISYSQAPLFCSLGFHSVHHSSSSLSRTLLPAFGAIHKRAHLSYCFSFVTISIFITSTKKIADIQTLFLNVPILNMIHNFALDERT